MAIKLSQELTAFLKSSEELSAAYADHDRKVLNKMTETLDKEMIALTNPFKKGQVTVTLDLTLSDAELAEISRDHFSPDSKNAVLMTFDQLDKLTSIKSRMFLVSSLRSDGKTEYPQTGTFDLEIVG